MPGIDYSIHSVNPLAQGPQPAATKADKKGFTFDDFLDIINPLQHLPVISTIYQHLTGDKIGLPEKILGDGLYGGVVGFACSVGDALFQEITGKSVGDTVYDFITGDDNPPTVVAKTPIAVTPASSLSLSVPDFSGLFESDDADAPQPTPPPETLQRATTAYQRALGHTIEAY
jgi:hypothetical protein